MSIQPAYFYEGKALELLYDCHALRFHNHSDTAQLAVLEGAAAQAWENVGVNLGAVEEAEEHYITDPSVPLHEKAERLYNRLRPILDYVLEDQSVSYPDSLVTFCQRQLDKLIEANVDEELRGENNGQLSAAAILPPPEVLVAIKRDRYDRHHSRCRLLENYVAAMVLTDRP